MIVNTSRFGSVEITDEDIINMPEGLVGFNNLTKYVLLDDPDDDLFAWMQSCEDGSIAFPILEPELFAANYKIDMTRYDLGALNMENMERARVFTIVTIPDDPTQMTANMKAPIVINVAERIGRQCVLQDSKLEIREPIFQRLQQRVVANAAPLKTQVNDLDVAVRLPSTGTNRMPEVES